VLKIEDISFGSILNPLLKTDTITDIMIWDGDIWVTDIYKGHYRINLQRKSTEEINEFKQLLLKLPRQIAMRMEVAYNDSCPILDGEGIFDDFGQLRFNCIAENITSTSLPAIAIRKTNPTLRINDALIKNTDYADQSFIELMKCLIDCGCNIMISGLTGSGKTELLRYLSGFIRDNQAIITLEDTLEAYLKKLYPSKNVLALKTNDKFDSEQLLKPCLRQNPDWICVSETRGREVLHLLEAVSTGHHLLSTIHASNAVSIPTRMLEMSKQEDDNNFFYQRIFSYINIGVYISYYNDAYGSHRKIGEVVEFYLDKDKKPIIHYLYRYDFKEHIIRKNKISSPTIISKLYENNTNVSHIEGEFL